MSASFAGSVSQRSSLLWHAPPRSRNTWISPVSFPDQLSWISSGEPSQILSLWLLTVPLFEPYFRVRQTILPIACPVECAAWDWKLSNFFITRIASWLRSAEKFSARYHAGHWQNSGNRNLLFLFQLFHKLTNVSINEALIPCWFQLLYP